MRGSPAEVRAGGRKRPFSRVISPLRRRSSDHIKGLQAPRICTRRQETATHPLPSPFSSPISPATKFILRPLKTASPRRFSMSRGDFWRRREGLKEDSAEGSPEEVARRGLGRRGVFRKESSCLSSSSISAVPYCQQAATRKNGLCLPAWGSRINELSPQRLPYELYECPTRDSPPRRPRNSSFWSPLLMSGDSSLSLSKQASLTCSFEG